MFSSVRFQFSCDEVGTGVLTPNCIFLQDYFVNARGIELFTKQWMPVHGLFRGVVLYCHGYADTCSYSFEGDELRC